MSNGHSSPRAFDPHFDSLQNRSMGYFFPYLLAAGTSWGFFQGGAFVWTGVFLHFVLVVALDETFKDQDISPGFLKKWLLHPGCSEFALFMTFPFLVVFLGTSLWLLSRAASALEMAGIAISAGIVMGTIAITSAHELIHRRPKWQRAEGVLNLALVNFCWFRLSHIEIHHRWVGTDQDPASAKAGELIWPYWLKSFWGNLKGSFQIEVERSGFSLKNRFWIYLGLALIFASAVFAMGSWSLLGFWIVISLIAQIMLMTVDYIEHKGLRRQILPSGRPEPVGPEHSWDSYHVWTNFALFKLGYHSHHHLKASEPFEELGRTQGAGSMQSGYPLKVLKALVGLA